MEKRRRRFILNRTNTQRLCSISINEKGQQPASEYWSALLFQKLNLWRHMSFDRLQEIEDNGNANALISGMIKEFDFFAKSYASRQGVAGKATEKFEFSNLEVLPEILSERWLLLRSELDMVPPVIPECLKKASEQFSKTPTLEELFSPVFVKNCRLMQKVYGLSDDELTILASLSYLDKSLTLREVLRCYSFREKGLALVCDILSALLDMPRHRVAEIININGKLVRLHIISLVAGSCDDFEDLFRICAEAEFSNLCWSEVDENFFIKSSISEMKKSKLTADDFTHIKGVREALLPFLKNAVSQGKGANVLLYGKPGTGKTELCRVIGEELGLNVFETRMAGKKEERWDNLLRGKAILSERGGAMLAVDEAEDLFAVSIFKGRCDKGYIVRLLEDPTCPVVWMTNSIDGIDSAMIRRFDIVLKIENPPRRKMEALVKEKLGGFLSSQGLSRITETTCISPAIIDQIASIADNMKQCCFDISEENLLTLIDEKIQAQGYGRLAAPKKSSIYDATLTNASCDLIKIAEGVRRTPSARLCFYGPPGTGKTAYAEWLAHYIGKPVITKKGSDLLGMYVGQTEQKIAAAFEEARRNDAVLILDEADSFLQDRKHAVRSWEVTQVNELLTQMEKFDGVFIAITNFFGTLDAAGMRRFDMKAKFDYMKSEQAEDLYLRYGKEWNFEARREDLSGLHSLTPGDFAAVNRRMRFTAEVNAESFVEALREEASCREEQRTPIGFC